ncbi:MAG: chemotaxis protein CheC [archaeon]
MDQNKLSDFEIDAMKEVGNIGSGNAAIRLSQMVNEKVEMNLTEIKIIDSKNLVNEYKQQSNDPVVSVFLRVKGDALGSIITVFDRKFSTVLLDLIEKNPIGTTKTITLECEEKFKAIGISLSESYINALGTFLNMNFIQTDPLVQINKKELVFRFLAKGISPYASEDMLILQTKFNVKKYSLVGEFAIIFGLKSLDRFKKAISKALGN